MKKCEKDISERKLKRSNVTEEKLWKDVNGEKFSKDTHGET
jgi:hypothetical protein